MSRLRDQVPLRLRAGDVVAVRSKEEILGTLDGNGSAQRLPFMPEMLRYCGQQFRVAAVAHKTCDPAHRTGARSLTNVVHLADLRCDGSAHGGCQAGCLLFWNTAWLKKPESPARVNNVQSPIETEEQLAARSLASTSTTEKPIYSCQATSLFEASAPLRWWDPRPYFRDVASGNVDVVLAAKVLLLSWLRALMRLGVGYRATAAVYHALHRALLQRPAPEDGRGLIAAGAPTPTHALELQPGERVRVRSNGEILQTLNRNNKNRGLWFDVEAAIFCGQAYQVERRIDRIINEVTGEMLHMKTPCITLAGVHCRGQYSRERLFCPRAIKPYWREIWLEREESA